MAKAIELTQGRVALVDDDVYEYLSQWKWCFLNHRNGYAMRAEEGNNSHKIYMHRVVVNAPDGLMVDHRDGDSLNNQRSNLRLCNNAQNLQNRGKTKANSTGYKGVTTGSKSKKYIAQIDGDYLGSFSDPGEAARTYDAAARERYGEFAVTNFEVA